MDFYFYYNIYGESDRPIHGDTKTKQSIRTGSASTSCSKCWQTGFQNVFSLWFTHAMAINSNTQCTNSPTQGCNNNSYILNSLLTLKIFFLDWFIFRWPVALFNFEFFTFNPNKPHFYSWFYTWVRLKIKKENILKSCEIIDKCEIILKGKQCLGRAASVSIGYFHSLLQQLPKRSHVKLTSLPCPSLKGKKRNIGEKSDARKVCKRRKAIFEE